MRTYVFAIAAVAMAVFAIPTTPAVSQVDVEIGRHGVRAGPGYHHGWGPSRCRQLRAACMHKEELGEQGMGNCRRYRAMCG
jgi:hypothetical protein